MNPGGLKGAPLLKIREEGGTGRNHAAGWQEAPTTAVAGRSFRVETYRARGQTLCQPGLETLPKKPGLKPRAPLVGLRETRIERANDRAR